MNTAHSIELLNPQNYSTTWKSSTYKPPINDQIKPSSATKASSTSTLSPAKPSRHPISSTVVRQYNKLLKTFTLFFPSTLELHGSVSFPHPYFAVTVFVPHSTLFHIDLTCVEKNKNRTRLLLSNNIRKPQHSVLHHQIPMDLPTDQWLTVVVPICKYLPSASTVRCLTLKGGRGTEVMRAFAFRDEESLDLIRRGQLILVDGGVEGAEKCLRKPTSSEARWQLVSKNANSVPSAAITSSPHSSPFMSSNSLLSHKVSATVHVTSPSRITKKDLTAKRKYPPQPNALLPHATVEAVPSPQPPSPLEYDANDYEEDVATVLENFSNAIHINPNDIFDAPNNNASDVNRKSHSATSTINSTSMDKADEFGSDLDDSSASYNPVDYAPDSDEEEIRQVLVGSQAMIASVSKFLSQ